MGAWTLLFGAALLAGIVALAVDSNRQRHEEVYKQRMQRGMLYYEIYPLIEEAGKHDIDRVLIERNRMVVFAVCPPGKIGEFLLADHGHRPLNAQRTWALAQAVAEDLPILQEGRCYRLKRYTMVRPNGQKDYGYQFTIRSKYKTQLMYARQQVRI